MTVPDTFPLSGTEEPDKLSLVPLLSLPLCLPGTVPKTMGQSSPYVGPYLYINLGAEEEGGGRLTKALQIFRDTVKTN